MIKNLYYNGKEVPFYKVDTEGNIYTEKGHKMSTYRTNGGFGWECV